MRMSPLEYKSEPTWPIGQSACLGAAYRTLRIGPADTAWSCFPACLCQAGRPVRGWPYSCFADCVGVQPRTHSRTLQRTEPRRAWVGSAPVSGNRRSATSPIVSAMTSTGFRPRLSDSAGIAIMPMKLPMSCPVSMVPICSKVSSGINAENVIGQMRYCLKREVLWPGISVQRGRAESSGHDALAVGSAMWQAAVDESLHGGSQRPCILDSPDLPVTKDGCLVYAKRILRLRTTCRSGTGTSDTCPSRA